MCAIIGVLNEHNPAAEDIVRGLEEQQHRGQRGAGLASWSDGRMWPKQPFTKEGLVLQIFFQMDMTQFPGRAAIGQNIYSTHDGTLGQPIRDYYGDEPVAMVHNGTIVNLAEISAKTGQSYENITDSRAIIDLLLQEHPNKFERALRNVAEQLRGSFNLIFLHQGCLWIIKDRLGLHPLQLGRRDNDWFVASEGYAFEGLRGNMIRDVRPGEFIIIEPDGCTRYDTWTRDTSLKFNIWEYTYFSAPPSIIHGVSVNRARYWMGYNLASEFKVEYIPHGALVVPVPNSGDHATSGFFDGLLQIHGRTDLTYRHTAVYRPHSINDGKRTFIQNTQQKREDGVRRKYRALGTEMRGKWIVYCDDSIVRGTTAKKLTAITLEAGAQGVLFAIPAAPTLFPDYYGGIDPRDPENLVARTYKGDQCKIAKHVGAKYVQYLSLKSQKKAIDQAAIETRQMEAVPPLQMQEEQMTINKLYCGMFDGVYPDGTPDT